MKNQYALVTGATSGIGLEFAKQLAARGYNIIAVARRQQQLQAVVDELPGSSHQYCVADLGRAEGVEAVVKLMAAQHVQLLINNAGYSVLEPFYQSDLSVQQDILNVNCTAVMTLAHTFLRQAQTGDALINLASVVSYLPTPAQPMYSASKAFISALSECLWDEHKGRGVYVMGLCPGVTKTAFILRATGGESDGQTLPEMLIQTTEQVVQEALSALDKRKKSIVITGWVNRMMMLMPRVLSRHRLIKVLSVIGNPDNAL
ncbi:SDR family oxidoreductase [Oceanicoccus sp. KOV_DT_Chl]|uniref:SDR family NAD(P)-dependent oxidoreductase n=1 Tax=Oceanicoccus sp. KOV_DT_Chl TaxID=1904639 RepID=UPI000C7CDC80|nr:SDR family NAD(P)-dependent oxidoreductase [Oceanicoccus sp. KOV_DT_Chl]